MAIDLAVQAAVEGRGRPLETDDERELQRLILAYGLCSDFGLVDEIVELFEPDAVWDGTAFRFPRCDGRDEIRSWFADVCGRDVRQVHVMELPLLWRGDAPDEARGIVPFNAMEASPDGKGVFAAQHAFGIYEDRYRKRDDAWRIVERTLHLRLVRR